jgi:hypothetical protein
MRRRPVSLVAVLLFVLSSSSCAIIGGSPEHYGGTATLDDAAAAARPDTSKSARKKKQRRLNVGETIPQETSVTIESESPAPEFGPGGEGTGPSHGSKADRGDTPALLSLVLGGGSIGGPRYDGFGEFGLEIGAWPASRFRLDLLGSVSPIQFSDETIAGQSFNNEFDLNLDVTARYYLTPSHTFMGAYPMVGVRAGTMFWDFAKPVTIVEDGVSSQVKSDYINHFSLYAGFGVSLIQIRHMQVSTNLLSGVRLYSMGTHHGFSNTLFPDCGFMQVRCEAGYKF